MLLARSPSCRHRYLGQHGGWDLESGSNDLMTIMLLVWDSSLRSVAALRPGAGMSMDAADIGDLDSRPGCSAFHLAGHRHSHRWESAVGTIVTSPQEFDAFVAAHPTHSPPTTTSVPTGIFLQSFELDTNNVEMAGFVWQPMGRRSRTRHAGRRAAGGGARGLQAEEAWRIELEDGTEQIGWYFSGTFRQNFDYRLYPLTARISGYASGLRSRREASCQCPISAPTAT